MTFRKRYKCAACATLFTVVADEKDINAPRALHFTAIANEIYHFLVCFHTENTHLLDASERGRWIALLCVRIWIFYGVYRLKRFSTFP